jgi:hypothetical protein
VRSLRYVLRSPVTCPRVDVRYRDVPIVRRPSSDVRLSRVRDV